MSRGIVMGGLLLAGFLAGWLVSSAMDFGLPKNPASAIRTALSEPDRLIRQRRLEGARVLPRPPQGPFTNGDSSHSELPGAEILCALLRNAFLTS